MAIVHESLYADENIEMTNFKEYAIKLVDHLRHSFQDNENKVVFIYSIDSVEIKLEKIILLGLIINEIVSNIFKYASNATYQIEVNIDLQVKNNTCTLLIKDNGPGFDMTKVNDQSLGLKLIQTLCQQLEAKYNLFHKEGVEHTITFSI
jgi:two-component sensor histidine kinase